MEFLTSEFCQNYIATIATVFLICCYIPQIKKTYQTKDVSSFSLSFFVMLNIALLCLVINALSLFVADGTWGYLLAESFNITLAFTLLVMILKYRKKCDGIPSPTMIEDEAKDSLEEGSVIQGYLANSLFSQSDIIYNEHIAKQLRNEFKNLKLYVPQENEALNDKNGYADSLTIFQGDNKHLDETEILFAVIDGAEIDSGVACEIGRFVALREQEIKTTGSSKKTIYALYTDIRQNGRDNQQKIDALIENGTENQFSYKNLYVIGAIKSCGKIFSNVEELIKNIHFC